jgi:DNA-binding transcriptional regulator PaaX
MDYMNRRILPSTALEYVILALIPFSEPNLKLAFKPNLFFKDLVKISKLKNKTLRMAYARAQKDGLIGFKSSNPYLTTEGMRQVEFFTAKKLDRNVCLMVVFDIPEDQSVKRQRLRRLLKELKFTQIQKSVWSSKYDYRDLLLKEIKEARAEEFVKLYEAAAI